MPDHLIRSVKRRALLTGAGALSAAATLTKPARAGGEKTAGLINVGSRDDFGHNQSHGPRARRR